MKSAHVESQCLQFNTKKNLILKMKIVTISYKLHCLKRLFTHKILFALGKIYIADINSQFYSVYAVEQPNSSKALPIIGDSRSSSIDRHVRQKRSF